ncbi:hypothetical protein [Micromonospora aurantiaca (nom. illeg.)]|uniref:hypothetical protein n=1 Tax=Micromonospora aurantiaca (nom. illeg.) TaxID=47850 RepID=UPI0033FF5EA2
MDPVRARWPEAALARHDVVVSAGALRHHRDLPAALRAMVLHASRLLLCAEDAGTPAPHEQVLAAPADRRSGSRRGTCSSPASWRRWACRPT